MPFAFCVEGTFCVSSESLLSTDWYFMQSNSTGLKNPFLKVAAMQIVLILVRAVTMATGVDVDGSSGQSVIFNLYRILSLSHCFLAKTHKYQDKDSED